MGYGGNLSSKIGCFSSINFTLDETDTVQFSKFDRTHFSAINVQNSNLWVFVCLYLNVCVGACSTLVSMYLFVSVFSRCLCNFQILNLAPHVTLHHLSLAGVKNWAAFIADLMIYINSNFKRGGGT